MILTSMTRGRLAIEVGTLAGYLDLDHPRAGSHGTADPDRARVRDTPISPKDSSRRRTRRSGRAATRGGIDVLTELSQSLEPGSVDVLFIDAQAGVRRYFETARSLLAVGGLVIADNVYGIGTGWID